MSMVMRDSINWGDVAEMDRLCGLMGIRSAPVRQWVDQLDFDPDAVLAQVDQLKAAEAQIRSSLPALKAAVPQEGVWTGASAEQMQENAECQWGFWRRLADFLLWLIQNILQLVDYLLEVLRIVVAWITWLVTAFMLAAAVIIIIVSAVGGMGIGAIFGALVDSAVLAVAGAITVVGALASLILVGLDWCVEWLVDAIEGLRKKICGKLVPTLPRWDPGYKPPGWPV